MALNENNIAIAVTGGIDTKTSSKLVEAGMFLDLQNTARRKTGAIEKRYGYSSLSKYTQTGAEILSGNRLDTSQNELLLIGDTYLHSYSPSAESWVTRGQVTPTLVTTTSIAAGPDVRVMPDGDVLNGIECTAWEDSRGGIRCTVIDTKSGTVLISDQVVTATGSRPKVVGIRASLVITYYVSGEFRCRRVTVGEPHLLQPEQLIEAGMVDAPYDITTFGNREYGIFAYNTASAIRVGALLQTGQVANILSGGVADPVNLTLRGTGAVSVIVNDSTFTVTVAYWDSAGASATDVMCSVLSFPMLTPVGNFEVEAAVNPVRNITGVPEGINTRLFYETETSSIPRVRHAQVSGTAVIEAPALLARSVGIASRAFRTQDRTVVTTVHESTLQSTYFTVAVMGSKVVAKIAPSKASGLTRGIDGVRKAGVPRVYSVGSYTAVPLAVRTRLDSFTSTVPSSYVGITRQSITFDNAEFDSATLGLNLMITGGILQDYDGATVVEHGFHLYPETITLASATTTGGLITPGNIYRVRVLYEWVDAQGQLHQSAPSITPAPVTVVVGPPANNSIVVTAPTLRLTDKQDVKIVAYRTEHNGTAVFYRDVAVANDPTVDTVTIPLIQADSTLKTQAILYTVGGTLDNIAPPSCVTAHRHKNRVFVAGGEDGRVWYSREHVEGEAVNFSDGLYITLTDVKGIETLNNNVVFFRDREIHILAGDGPVDTGTQNDYGIPERLPGDVGLVNQKSLVSTPIGLMFKSHKGIYLLTEGYQQVYIGDKVEKFNHLDITSAVLLKDNNEVRFTTSSDVTLVYNYYFKEWHTFTNHVARSATAYNDTFYHVRQDGTVNQEVIGQFNDNGARYSMRIETCWFKFARLQGFQRLYYWGLLGDFVSDHYTKVSIAYDYEKYYTDPVYFNTITGLEQTMYGTGDYGSETPYGGEGSSVYQFRSKPEQQKCEAFKMVIEDVDTITPAGGGSFKLEAITFQLGVKQGLYKMSNSKTRG